MLRTLALKTHTKNPLTVCGAHGEHEVCGAHFMFRQGELRKEFERSRYFNLLFNWNETSSAVAPLGKEEPRGL